MATSDTQRNKISSQLSALNSINLTKPIDASGYKDDLGSTNGIVTKNINDFTSKVKGKTDNKKNIFEELINTADPFIGYTNKNKEPINPKAKPIIQKKLLRYAKDAANITLQSSKSILSSETKKAFFGAAGICTDATLTGTDSYEMSPREFDFINVLKIDPNSVSGKLMYENPIDLGTGTIKFNRTLYENFDIAPTPYSFKLQDNSQLFSIVWNPTVQKYNISGFVNETHAQFIDQYYNTIEHPDIQSIMANAMQMTLQGDGSESISFNDGMKYLNRLLTKLSSLCGSPDNSKPMVNNTPEQISEDEMDDENYFDFDDTEGVDLDDEDSKYRRVLKFQDCNNFEVPTNSNHIEDFSYLLGQKNLDENIDSTLNKAASDAYEQYGGGINLDGFQLSLNRSYLLKIPKALMSAVLSPKMIFPIALTYKRINATGETPVRDLMKKVYKIFKNALTAIFWKYIQEFWKFIKKDLLNFIKETAALILQNKLKKIKGIIQALINILLKILDRGIHCCQDIFGAVLKTINTAISRKVNIPVSGFLLSIADSSAGYSPDSAQMRIMEKLNYSGIYTGPIYGTENKFPFVIKSILEGHSEEMDENSFVKIGMKPTIIPVTGANAYITPLVVGAGKVF